jgi:hypothetical protein
LATPDLVAAGFPEGEKGGEKIALSLNVPAIYSKNGSRMCLMERNHGNWRFFPIFFMQH